MRKRYIILFIYLFILLFANSCNSKQLIDKNAYKLNDTNIPPDNCLIEAEVIEVLPVIDNADGKLCSEIPCNALVKINKIIGYGSSFPVVFSTQKKIAIHFKFGLKSTVETKQKLSYILYGLSKGDKFKAKIEAHEQIGKPNIQYTIYYYQKL